jgi:uncharacterized protein (DUF924 family)
MKGRSASKPWNDVLDFWFPDGRTVDIGAQAHWQHWIWRMHGGADQAIIARFAELAVRGAAGDLDHWASDPEGRLALIIVLDQFSRSLWRGQRRAFGQDAAALKLSRDGLDDGHYQALDTPWFKIAHTQPLGHCEGPDHLERIDLLISLRKEIAASVPDHLQPIYRSLVKQASDVRNVIAAFGRHPHRNQVIGRESTPEEQAYIAGGAFPHLRAFQM